MLVIETVEKITVGSIKSTLKSNCEVVNLTPLILIFQLLSALFLKLVGLVVSVWLLDKSVVPIMLEI